MGLSDEINLQERGFIVIGSTDGNAGSDETGRLNNQGCMSRQTGCGGREWEVSVVYCCSEGGLGICQLRLTAWDI